MVSFPLVLFPYVSPPLRARLSPLPFGAGTFARVLTCTGYGRKATGAPASGRYNLDAPSCSWPPRNCAWYRFLVVHG